MKITFLGGVQEVTGSKTVVEHEKTKILVDCGLFQGDYKLRKLNRKKLPIKPSTIQAVVLTHAHIDHTGYLPVLVRKGFSGTIYCSRATAQLCEILLKDSAFLQEEYSKKMSKKKGKPIAPLYTVNDAHRALSLFKVVDFNTPFAIGSLTIELTPAGHILGAAFVTVDSGTAKLTFSGDLGRPNQLIMKAPANLTSTDYLVLESTYGNRLHQNEDPLEVLKEAVQRTVSKNGVLIIPAFAVGRTQALLYCLYQLAEKKLIPNIPVFLDSPMGSKVTDLLCQYPSEHRLSPTVCKRSTDIAQEVRTQQHSKRLTSAKRPFIILAGSGMADGGRVLDHLKRFLPDPKNMFLFVGFQAKGSIGRKLTEGIKKIRLDRKQYDVRAAIHRIDNLSAHADYQELLEWLSHLKKAPKKTFLNHGELEAAQALKQKIEERFGWKVIIPAFKESFELD